MTLAATLRDPRSRTRTAPLRSSEALPRGKRWFRWFAHGAVLLMAATARFAASSSRCFWVRRVESRQTQNAAKSPCCGKSGSPKLVLLHGFLASPRQYPTLMPALVGQFHVIAPDSRGFGNSSVPDPKPYRYSFDKTTETVEVFLRKIGLGKAGFYRCSRWLRR